MTEYFNIWKNYLNFSDRTTRKGFWMAVLFNIIASLGVLLIGGIIHFNFLPYIYLIAIFIPMVALCVRRLRDAGRAWQWIFIVFLPGIGEIILFIFFCFDSAPDNGIPVV